MADEMPVKNRGFENIQLRHGCGGRASIRQLTATAMVAASLAAHAGGPTVPDAVRPGALRPGEERPVQVPTPTAEVYEVPPVIERPLDIDAGAKIQVERFELVGAIDRPEFEISTREVEALVEGKRSERPEGFTVGRLQEVAAEVTKYYREHGLILAQAFIPVQTVEGGVVQIEVLEGKLGRVLVEGNQIFKTRLLEKPFEPHVGEPVTKAKMESVLLGLTDYPGLSLFGVFQPGQQVGEADIVLKVQEERRFDWSMRVDNHGLRETGERRYTPELFINNITGAGDHVELSALGTSQPENQFFWRVGYERPVFKPGYTAGFSYDENEFDVLGEFRRQGLASDTTNAHLYLTKSFLRSRQANLSGTIDLARREARTKQRGRPISEDDLAVLNMQVDFDWVDTRFAGLNVGSVIYSHGFNDLLGALPGQGGVQEFRARPTQAVPSRQGGSRDFATGQFDKIFLNFSRLQALSILSEKLRHHSLLVRGEFQWSDDLLVPLEQYAIGGPNNVRAYQPTEALADRAVFLSLEWIVNAPGFADKPAPFGNRTWGELVQVSMFYDVAVGRLNDPISRSDGGSNNYNGAGFSVAFNNPNVFSTRFTFGFPLDEPRPANDRDPQYWLDFNFYY
jgi:hemolysin activation/secretion protein